MQMNDARLLNGLLDTLENRLTKLTGNLTIEL